jgi:hypothetical protein
VLVSPPQAARVSAIISAMASAKILFFISSIPNR